MIGTRSTKAFAIAIATFSLASLAAVTMAEAKVIQFKGTRAQVHAACKALGLEAFDSTAPGYMGSGSTTCVNDAKGTAVTCNDNGTCEGSVPRIYGQLDLRGILAGTFVTVAPALPPASLSESGPSEVPEPLFDGAPRG